MFRAIQPLVSRAESPTFRVLDRELARIVAALGEIPSSGFGGNPAEWLGEKLVVGGTLQDDFHHLTVMARLSVSSRNSERGRISRVLIGLDRKAADEKVVRDSFWPLRIEELTAALVSTDESISHTILRSRRLGRPDHLPIVKHLKATPAERANVFVAAAKDDPDYAWTPGIVALLAGLPPAEVRPVLLTVWDRGGLEDAVVPVLARDPRPEDRPKYLVGLRSFSPDVVRVSAAALGTLPKADDPADTAAAVVALRRLPDDKPAAAARAAVTAFLRGRTGQAFGAEPAKWSDWFAKAHPTLAAKLNETDGFDAAAWARREAGIPWADGDPARGRAVFTKATCAACHDGGGAVGPSLVGVGKRFGRDDLLTAILRPGKDVSPRYRPTRLTTADGKAYTGMVVYEATSGVILQTGPDAAVRVAGDQIESKRTLDTSLMPAGLLDKLADREVADLLAYLRTLNSP